MLLLWQIYWTDYVYRDRSLSWGIVDNTIIKDYLEANQTPEKMKYYNH
jgi:hypothetical protein